jgi:ABC-type Fe3+ transport system permease subunit
MEVQVNMWAVLAAMLSSMAVGSIWYAPSVFGKAWMKLARVDTSNKNADAFKPIVTTALVSLITAYVLAHVAFLSNQYFGNSFLQASLSTAFWMWLGFVAARFITHDAFEGRPANLTLINIGNELATFMAMGLTFGLIGI